MDFTEKSRGSISKYDGVIISVQVDRVELPNGDETLREVVIHPGGVAVMPVDDDGFAYMVSQYRYPMSDLLLEIPAGKLEPGEDTAQCARRELSEETGIEAETFEYLGEVYPSPGFCRESLYIYLATGLSFGLSHPDENEFLDVKRVHMDELFAMAMDGRMKDAKTIIAVLKAKIVLGG